MIKLLRSFIALHDDSYVKFKLNMYNKIIEISPIANIILLK